MKKLPTRWSPSTRKKVHHKKSEAEKAVLQRLLIFHLGLLPSDGVLDERSSLEELSEYILYYYDYEMEQQPVAAAQRQPSEEANGSNTTTTTSNGSHATEEAVQFAGLCRALQSLPTALLEEVDQEDDEKSQCIHLDHAMLVFVSLEDDAVSSGLTAVAQVTAEEHHPVVSPLVIQDLLQQWHKLFCILRGGGVDVRLKQLKPEQVGTATAAPPHHHFDDYDQATTAASSAISSCQDASTSAAAAATIIIAAGAAARISNHDDDDDHDAALPSSIIDHDDSNEEEHRKISAASVVGTKPSPSSSSSSSDNQQKQEGYYSYSHTAAALSLLAATSTSATLQAASSQGGETYPGLEQLYTLRKEMRVLQNDLVKSTQVYQDKKAALERQVEGCRSQLEEQLSLSKDILPSLREDLQMHYTERLLLANQFRLRLPKVSTAIPPPSSITTPSVTQNVSFPALQLGRVIRKLLNNNDSSSGAAAASSNDNDRITPLVGISTFHRSLYWFTHFAKSHQSILSSDTTATSTLLLEYLMSFRDHGNNIKTSRFGRRRKTAASDGALFLSTPPLSRLSVSEEIYQVSHPMYETIWTPKVYLPSTSNNNGNNRRSYPTTASSFHMVHVALLEIPATQHQFLVYFDPEQLLLGEDWTSSGLGEGSLSLVMDSLHQQSTRAISESNVVHEMFTNVTRELTTCIQDDLVLTTTKKATSSSSSSSNHGSNNNNKDNNNNNKETTANTATEWKHPGTLLIIVEDSVVQHVYVGTMPRKSGSSSSSGSGKTSISTSTKNSSSTSNTSSTTTTTKLCFSKNDMDGTIQLSEAAWMALEDYYLFQEQKQQQEQQQDGEQEACEYLFDQSGWIWSCSIHHRSLYMILDSSTFVTIAEVENCTDKARQMFL